MFDTPKSSFDQMLFVATFVLLFILNELLRMAFPQPESWGDYLAHLLLLLFAVPVVFNVVGYTAAIVFFIALIGSYASGEFSDEEGYFED